MQMVELNKSQEKSPVSINEPWCKNCEICVEFCPKHVFEMINGRAVVVRPEACNLCGVCQLRCPDFAIILEDREDD